MKVLITGISGFVGSHLAEYLIRNTDWEVVGMTRWGSKLDNLQTLIPRINKGERLRLVEGDLRDAISINNVFSEGFDFVFHLAAQSYPLSSYTSPVETLQTNAQGTLHVLEAVKKYCPEALVHNCSSSEVYGNPPTTPITEDCPFNPVSPYAISKASADMMGKFYSDAYGMKVMTTRMFTHSVSRWTPVIVRDRRSGLIDVRYISDLRVAGKRGGYFSGKILDDGTQIWDFRHENLDVWNDGGWTKIKHLSCHPIGSHSMVEVATRSGFVDVTDNHSIINNDGVAVCASQLSENDKLKTTELPSVELTDIPEDLAWLYGFFVAEGCMTHGKLRIDNKDKTLLDRCKSALLTYFACDSYYQKHREGDVIRLTIRKPNKFLTYFEDCYAKDKNKKIPRIILNAKKSAKLAFLRGYNHGDGRTHHPKLDSEFVSFKTKSPILAMGLVLLSQEVLGVKVRVYVERRNDSRYFDIAPHNQTGSNRGNHRIKSSNEITSIVPLYYQGEVWDFETENHWFNAGVGGLIVHNTGPRRGDVFAESSFAKQIAMIEAGQLDPPMKVGNLDSLRTVADVRDAVRAYHLLMTKDPVPGAVYNIGGNYTCTVAEIMLALFECAEVQFNYVVDKTRIRPLDATLQVPDCSKFKDHTGWEPEIPFGQTMGDLLNYWRLRVKRGTQLQR